VFSFHPVKIITNGEGGVTLTSDEELAARMEMLRSHGVTSNNSGGSTIAWRSFRRQAAFHLHVVRVRPDWAGVKRAYFR